MINPVLISKRPPDVLPVHLWPLYPIFVRGCKWHSTPLHEMLECFTHQTKAAVCRTFGIKQYAQHSTAQDVTAAGTSCKLLGFLGKCLQGKRHLSCGIVPPANASSCLTSFAISNWNSAALKWSPCYGANKLHSSGSGFVHWKVRSVNFTLSKSLKAGSADLPAVTSTFLCWKICTCAATCFGIKRVFVHAE